MLFRLLRSFVYVGIFHFGQIQSTGQRRFGSFRTILGLDHFLKFIYAHSPGTNIDQGSNHRAYHVPQEPVSAYGEYELSILFRPFRFSHITKMRFHIGTGTAEGTEVLLAQQMGSSLVHSWHIQIVKEHQGPAFQKRVLAEMHEILIGTLLGIEACMRIDRYWNDALYCDILMQHPVQTAKKFLA